MVSIEVKEYPCDFEHLLEGEWVRKGKVITLHLIDQSGFGENVAKNGIDFGTIQFKGKVVNL